MCVKGLAALLSPEVSLFGLQMITLLLCLLLAFPLCTHLWFLCAIWCACQVGLGSTTFLKGLSLIKAMFKVQGWCLQSWDLWRVWFPLYHSVADLCKTTQAFSSPWVISSLTEKQWWVAAKAGTQTSNAGWCWPHCSLGLPLKQVSQLSCTETRGANNNYFHGLLKSLGGQIHIMCLWKAHHAFSVSVKFKKDITKSVLKSCTFILIQDSAHK